ncbi:hypothetical protein ACFS3C_13475 [Azotobacter vinelandii]
MPSSSCRENCDFNRLTLFLPQQIVVGLVILIFLADAALYFLGIYPQFGEIDEGYRGLQSIQQHVSDSLRELSSLTLGGTRRAAISRLALRIRIRAAAMIFFRRYRE